MPIRKKLMATTVALSMLAPSCGAAEKGNTPSLAGTLERTPRLNADGNYNIVFIVTDQEHHFEEYPEGSAYEARKLLADLGTTFEKHYACATMSTSSRSVIYTGTHIPDTKMIDNTDFDWQGALSEELTTVGDRMRSAGYYTAYKGKLHMGNAGILGDDDEEPLTDLEGYGFADWNVSGDYIGTKWEGYEKDEEIEGAAAEWLQTRGAERNAAGQSFFLAVNLINPHDVMYYNTDPTFHGMVEVGGAPDDPLYEKSYDVGIPDSWNQNLYDGTLPAAVGAYKARWERQTGSVTTAEGWKDFRDYYFNCIQDSDNHLTDLLRTLIGLDMLDNTIIVFTADHGEMGGAHSLKGKGGVIYEENIHVPLIIVHPEHPGGRSISSVTSHIDLAPTFVNMTNISSWEKAALTRGLCGKNLMELMDGSAESVRDSALFCFEMISMTMAQGSLDSDGQLVYTFDTDVRGFVRAIITERYKFARYFSSNFNKPKNLHELLRDNDIELYDLQNDPEEMNNLARDPAANAVLITELNNRLNSLIDREIGKDDGSEFFEAIAAYTGEPLPSGTQSGGCDAGTASAAALLLLVPAALLAGRRFGKQRDGRR
ncbi:MAG: sulfatase-like hydrolase/transferase [Synergistales bacterium]